MLSMNISSHSSFLLFDVLPLLVCISCSLCIFSLSGPGSWWSLVEISRG